MVFGFLTVVDMSAHNIIQHTIMGMLKPTHATCKLNPGFLSIN